MESQLKALPILCMFLTISLDVTFASAGNTQIKTAHNETILDNNSLLYMIYQMNSTIYELKENLTEFQYSRRTDVQHSNFLAVMTQSSQAVAYRGIVQFPRVRHNVAPSNFGYDEKLSFYRCPENGTYVFAVSLSVYESKGGHHRYSIMKEGSMLASTNTYTSSSTNKKVCSITVTTPCKKGEDVWVANTYSSTRTVYSDYGGSSHFTGFRLY